MTSKGLILKHKVKQSGTTLTQNGHGRQLLLHLKEHGLKFQNSAHNLIPQINIHSTYEKK